MDRCLLALVNGGERRSMRVGNNGVGEGREGMDGGQIPLGKKRERQTKM